MTGPQIGLALSVFLACTVEAVEALTIVLAVGMTRSWRSALSGAGSAVLVLAALTAVLGPAIDQLPLDPLRLGVGALSLAFGLRWQRKAILRAAGLKAQRDEDAAYARTSEEARAVGAPLRTGALDRYAFTVAFQGALIEGLEVVFIAVSFGTSQRDMGLAAAAAGAAVVVVALAGVLIHRPLARVPENPMKFAVGVMVISFGIFWIGEGAGLAWPGGDAVLIGLVAATLAVSLGLVAALRRQVATRAGRRSSII